MRRFLLSRILNSLVTLWGLATIVFFIAKLTPGDEAQAAAGRNASPEQVEIVRQQLGLDQPLLAQYWLQLQRLFVGDVGTSNVTLQPVATDLANLFPSTMELVLSSTALAVVMGTVTAVAASSMRGRMPDAALRIVAVIAGGLPAFWLAYILQWLLGASWKILPVSGQISVDYVVPRITGVTSVDALLSGNVAAFGDAASHLVLPSLVLALASYAGLFRTLRASMSSTLEEDYIDVVRAKGASAWRLLFGHALRNAAIPSVSVIGLQLGWAIAGAILVEAVFARQGIGSYLSNAVLEKDNPAVFGTVLLIGGIIVMISLLVDLAHLALDPRIRRTEAASA